MNTQTKLLSIAIAKVLSVSIYAISSPLALANESAVATVPDDIEVLEVKGVRQKIYGSNIASSATLLPMPINETPFNIGIITEDLIQDRQVDTLADAVLLNASVNRNHSHSNNSPNFKVRGFGLDADRLGYLINGMPVAATDAPPAHISALQQIEILKGTAALFYGAGEPAGVINYVYKTPLETAQYSIQSTIGRDDEYRAEFDATGPITNNLFYRFTLGWEDSKGPVDFNYSKDLAPTLQLLWKPTDDTNIRFIGEHVKHEGNPMSADIVFFDGEFIEGPSNQYLGFTTDYDEQDSTGFQIQAEHAFNDDVSIVLQAGMKDGGREAGNSGYFAFLPFTIPGFSDVENGIALRSVFDQKRRGESEYLAGHVNWNFMSGDIEHSVVVGMNYSKNQIENIGNFNSIANVIPQLLAGDFSVLALIPPSIDFFNPVPVPFEHATNFDDSPPFYRDIWEYDNFGFNIQDAIDIPSMDLMVLLGLRYATSGANTILSIEQDGTPGTGFGPDTDESKWLPRVGVVYDATEQHSFYISYGESFKPPFTSARDRNGNAITEPETGEQIELGWRGEYFDGKLQSTLAAYELTKNNVIVSTFEPNVSEVAGEQVSKGIELDILGEVNDTWSIFFSYAYTDTEVVDAGSATATEGERFPGIPKHKLNLWNNFSADWSGIEGLDLGYGISYGSDIVSGVVDIATLGFTNQEVAGQGVVHNASVGYTLETESGELEVDLVFNNIFDRFYVENVDVTIFAKRGMPRSVLLTGKWTF